MKRIATLCVLVATVGACSYGPLYRGPIAPVDARLRKLGPVAASGTGYNSGIATGRAHEELWRKARACGAEQIVDAYEEGTCLEGLRWVLFFLPTCSTSVSAMAVTYKASPAITDFQKCVERADDGSEEVASE